MDEKRGENGRVPLSQVAVAATVARAQQQARATRRRSSSSNTETRACARAHQTQLYCDARVFIGTHGTSLRWLKLDQQRLKRAARARNKNSNRLEGTDLRASIERASEL